MVDRFVFGLIGIFFAVITLVAISNEAYEIAALSGAVLLAILVVPVVQRIRAKRAASS